MPHTLPYSLIILTSISLTLSLVTVTLTFLNTRQLWENLAAGILTIFYHTLVILLVWCRTRRQRLARANLILTDASGKGTPPPIPRHRTPVPYPVMTITLGFIILVTWIISFGTTIDVAIKGPASAFASPSSYLGVGRTYTRTPTKIDRAGLVESSVAIGAEIIVLGLFIWCCMRKQKNSDVEARDQMEEKVFYPDNNSTLERSGTLGSLQRSQSSVSNKAEGSTATRKSSDAAENTPSTPLPPVPAEITRNVPSRMMATPSASRPAPPPPPPAPKNDSTSLASLRQPPVPTPHHVRF